MRLLFLVCLAMGLSLLGEAAHAGMSEDVQQSSQRLAVWQQMNQTQPGVYEKEGLLYVYVKRSAQLGNLRDHRQWAKMEVCRELFRWGFLRTDEAMKLSPMSRSAASIGGMVRYTKQFSGSVLLNRKLKDSYEYLAVYNVKDASVKNSELSVETVVRDSVDEIIRHPLQYQKFFEDNGLDEFSLLNDVSALVDQKKYNVVLWQNHSKTIEFQKQHIRDVLKRKKIKQYSLSYRTPILQQIAEVQGFAAFDSTLAQSEFVIFPYIDQYFRQGKELEVATFLLEYAAEIAPRCARTWEYLSAAYKAGAQREKAIIAARVWYLLADDKSEALKFLLDLQKDQYQEFHQLMVKK